MNLNAKGGLGAMVWSVWDASLDENVNTPMYFFSNSPVK